jgi:ketosteroid isomerase-like protein
MATERAITALLDRAAITETLYRYGSCIDRRDYAGLRAVFADDVCAQYGNGDPIVGADALVRWIDESAKGCLWQHHMLSVYHIDVRGDEANALVYHTSHRVFEDDPGTVGVLVGRYYHVLRRTADSWQIGNLLLEVLWAERRTDVTGYLHAVGGRGPKVA